MIASILIWTYILIFAYIYGWNIIDISRRVFKIEQDIDRVSKAIIVLVGLCGITFLAGILSLFLNLGGLAQAIFFLLGLSLGWRMWKKGGRFPTIHLASIPWWLYLFFCLIFLSILILGTRVPSNPDTGIYHAQAIRWMETYPVVPGLGNLHSRLAYNSNWLVVNALFSFSFLGLGSFHGFPGAFMLAALLYFLEGIHQLHQGQPSIVSMVKVALIPLIFYLSSSQISSPGTDFPTYLLVWVTFLLWIETFESGKGHPNGSFRLEEIAVFLFSVTLVTIKLSMLTVVLLAGFIILKHLRRNGRGALKLVVLALILLAPWLTRNLILSGYWVYPVPVVASLSPAFDWKIPLDKVAEEASVIQAWARIPRADAADVLSMPLSDWSREWFENLTSNQMILVAGALLSPILYLLSVVTGLRKKSFLGTYTFTFLVAYASVLFWLFEAPDIRFGYGLVVLAILLALAPLVHHLLTRITFQKAAAYLMIAMLMLYQGSVLYHSLDLDTFAARVLLPADYDSLSTTPCSIHEYSLFCAEWYNICGYDSFPCIPPSSADPRVGLRRQTIRDGFRSIPGE